MGEEIKQGNPIAKNRFRWQTYLKADDQPMESEWEQLKMDAIKHASKYLIRNYNRFKQDDTIVKIFNEMNYKQKPTIITLQSAYWNLGQELPTELKSAQ